MENGEKYSDTFLSIIGKFTINASDKGITSIQRVTTFQEADSISNEYIKVAIIQLEEYFEGNRRNFNVELDLSGFTSFQQEVWGQLLKIGYGQVLNYKELAIRCGDEKKVRAVGRANGTNPIPIIIPCHRVIGSDGSLVGFSQGLDMKQYLLELENAPVQLNLF